MSIPFLKKINIFFFLFFSSAADEKYRLPQAFFCSFKLYSDSGEQVPPLPRSSP